MLTYDRYNSPRPLVIGHRGKRGKRVENTIGAFLEALDEGADGIEIDVRLSSDGIPVVIHDATFDRTTELRGLVSTQTAAVAARAGVPSFEQVISLAQTRDALLLVEIKTEKDNARDLTSAVAGLLAGANERARAIVLSFDHAALVMVKEADPSIQTAASVMPTVTLPRPSAQWVKDAVRRAAADAVALHQLLATRARVDALVQAAIGIHAWTVNRVLMANRMARFGVTSIITDVPASLVRAYARPIP